MNPSIKLITRRIIYLKVLLSNLAHSAFEAHFWPILSNCVLDFTHDHPNNIVADSAGELPSPAQEAPGRPAGAGPKAHRNPRGAHAESAKERRSGARKGIFS
ncbi:MAG TPA: hypothetical protein DEA63_00270 [Firmicutes bacterium]|nr:hypothetical protein [Bacillota bacterium]